MEQYNFRNEEVDLLLKQNFKIEELEAFGVYLPVLDKEKHFVRLVSLWGQEID